MRVGSLIKMSLIFASSVSSDCNEISAEDEGLRSLVLNGLNVLGRGIGVSSMSEVDDGSISVNGPTSDWRLLG